MKFIFYKSSRELQPCFCLFSIFFCFAIKSNWNNVTPQRVVNFSTYAISWNNILVTYVIPALRPNIVSILQCKKKTSKRITSISNCLLYISSLIRYLKNRQSRSLILLVISTCKLLYEAYENCRLAYYEFQEGLCIYVRKEL